jgi:multidrug efflux pump
MASTGVVGSMLSATVLAVLLEPVFFVVVLRLFRVKRLNDEAHETASKLQPVHGE